LILSGPDKLHTTAGAKNHRIAKVDVNRGGGPSEPPHEARRNASLRITPAKPLRFRHGA
jgi:hypothetical protein